MGKSDFWCGSVVLYKEMMMENTEQLIEQPVEQPVEQPIEQPVEQPAAEVHPAESLLDELRDKVQAFLDSTIKPEFHRLIEEIKRLL